MALRDAAPLIGLPTVGVVDAANSLAYYEKALANWNRGNKLAAPGPYAPLYIAPLQRKLAEPDNVALIIGIVER